MRVPPTRNGVIAVAAVVLASCGGESTTSPAGVRGVKVVSAALAPDTIQATIAELLRVEVRDSSGHLAPSVRVELRVSPTTAGGNLRALVCDANTASCSAGAGGVDVYTDASGIATARLRHGQGAGNGTITIAAPSIDASASLAYTTLPGLPAGFVINHADTSVDVGASYALTAQATDRFGNARTDAVTIEALTPGVATFANGAVTAVGYGRASFALHDGSYTGNAALSVVIPGRLLAADPSQSPGIALVLMNTDGGARRTLLRTPAHNGYAYPGWDLDGHRVTVLESAPNVNPRMFAYDTTTLARAPLADTVAYPQSLLPSFPRSGTSLYFAAKTAAGDYGIFRAPTSGAVQLVVSDRAYGIVAPDESSILLGTPPGVINRNLQTGDEKLIAATHYTPFWTPAGDLVGYLVPSGNGTVLDLHVVRPDGTGDRLLSANVYDASTFSPDGQWIATIRIGQGIELVRVSDGLKLPVGGTGQFNQVAWRPR